MRRPDFVALFVSACVLAFAPPVAGQAPAKLLCSPETVTRCARAGDCRTDPATEDQKRSPIVLDFAAKKVLSRQDDEDSPIGDIVEDKMEGGRRLVNIRRLPPQQDRPGMRIEIAADGRAEGTLLDGTGGFVARCTPL